MIAVDTSALISIVLDEPAADACMDALERNGSLLISAATLVETMIVAVGRGVRAEAERLFDELPFEIVSVTPASARLALDAHARWGKGVHPARLNYGDCFAYALARERDCPLLFIGDDFARTDIRPALAAT